MKLIHAFLIFLAPVVSSDAADDDALQRVADESYLTEGSFLTLWRTKIKSSLEDLDLKVVTAFAVWKGNTIEFYGITLGGSNARILFGSFEDETIEWKVSKSTNVGEFRGALQKTWKYVEGAEIGSQEDRVLLGVNEIWYVFATLIDDKNRVVSRTYVAQAINPSEESEIVKTRSELIIRFHQLR